MNLEDYALMHNTYIYIYATKTDYWVGQDRAGQ